MEQSIKRLVAFGSVALVVLLTMVGAAAAEPYTTDFEAPTFSTTVGPPTAPAGSVDGQDGWHSAIPGDIPALPNGYDQAVVDNSPYPNYVDNGGDLFGDQSLRVSNAYTEPSGEFFFQTYSKSTTENAGEDLDNTEYTGEFQFIPTTVEFQPNLDVRISPDNGEGGRMSFVRLMDTDAGIKMTFFDTDASGAFVGHELGIYVRDKVHTIKFWIKFVDGPANDIVRLFVDGTDMGDKLGECFTTWEQFYREVSHEPVPVTNSIEFRVQGNGNTITDLVGGGYLFDNVINTTANGDGPAPGTCGLANDGVIAPTGTTCQQYRDDVAPVLGQVQYTTKGSGSDATVNSVSPGVFFYYTKVSGDAGDMVAITEENNGTPPSSPIPVQQGQVFLYDASTCTKLKWDVTDSPAGLAEGWLPSDGDFIIGVKYNPSALKGQAAPASPPVTYSFGTTLNGAPFQVESTIDLALKTGGPNPTHEP